MCRLVAIKQEWSAVDGNEKKADQKTPKRELQAAGIALFCSVASMLIEQNASVLAVQPSLLSRQVAKNASTRQ